MKQFNLQEYLANPSRQVVTRDGRPVRIICTDSDAEGGSIVAIVTGVNQRKKVLLYYENGKYYSFDSVSEDDLFFAPEKKEGWVNVYRNGEHLWCGYIKRTETEAKEFEDIEFYITTIKIEWEE